MANYVVGSINKNKEVLRRIEKTDLIDYYLWECQEKFEVCERRKQGTSIHYYVLETCLTFYEANSFLDKILSGEIIDNYNFVMCRICGERSSNLSSAHIVSQHCSLKEYSEMFPEAPTNSLLYSQHRSEDAKLRDNLQLLRKHSDGTKDKIRQAKLGTTRSESAKRKQSESMKRKWQDPDYRERTSEAISKVQKELWKDSEHAYKMMKSWQVKPNSVEELVGSLLGSDFEYVGDGKISLEGFIPDFINTNGKKEIVEVNGCYWHACEECGFGDIILQNGLTSDEIHQRDLKKLEVYQKYGYKTHVIWEHEIKELKLIV